MGAITGFELLKQVLTLGGTAFLAISGAALLPFFMVSIAVDRASGPDASRRRGDPEHDSPRGQGGRGDAHPRGVAACPRTRDERALPALAADHGFPDGVETRTGLYATAFRVFEMLIALPTLVLAVALPVLAVAGSEDRDRLRYGVQRLTEVSLVVALGLSVAVVGFAAPAIHLLGGDHYTGAVPILRVQAWALVPLFLGQVFALSLLALRRQRQIALANIVAVVAVIVLGLALIPMAHGRGAALAGVITECALAFALLVLLAVSDRAVVPSFRFAWRPLLALLAGIVALFGIGLRVGQGIVATGAFLGVAVLTRAVPPAVFDALARGRAGSS